MIVEGPIFSPLGPYVIFFTFLKNRGLTKKQPQKLHISHFLTPKAPKKDMNSKKSYRIFSWRAFSSVTFRKVDD